MLNVKKIYNGLEDTGHGYKRFSWTIIIGDTPFKYFTSLGLSSIKRVKNKQQISVMVSDETLLPAYSTKSLDKRPLLRKDHIYVNVPRTRDVLYALANDYSVGNQTFREFCSNYGYEYDSRKALDLYLETQDVGDNLMRLLGTDKIERILKWEL